MPGTPKFTISTPPTLTGMSIKTEPNVGEFLRDSLRYISFPYFTLDLKITKEIPEAEGGLEAIAELAHRIEQKNKGILQLVNVAEEVYYDLMNTNIGGKRLISLAEIYTHRDGSEITAFMDMVRQNVSSLGIGSLSFLDAPRESYFMHEGLHGSYNGIANYYEMMRRRKEFMIIQFQELIEQNKPDKTVIQHLGYRFGEVDRIKQLDDIPDMIRSWRERVQHSRTSHVRREGMRRRTPQTYRKGRGQLEEGLVYSGVCTVWKDKKGYGFIKERTTGKSVFVHYTNITFIDPDFHLSKILRIGERYSFKVRYEPGRRDSSAIEVTPSR